MAKIEQVERMLRTWAEVVTSGRDGSGFPSMSVLHPDWSPPSPGQTPTLKSVPLSRDVDRTHRAIAMLSIRMANTVVVHYCKRLTLQEQAEMLECSPDTVTKRISEIHRLLWRELAP